MSLDRFVRWDSPEQKPSTKEILEVLEDYLGDPSLVRCFDPPQENGRPPKPDDDWFFATLPGKPTSPFARQPHSAAFDYGEERWFEVCCIHEKSIDVITRQTDEFTNNVARGFADLVARWFKGELE